MWLEIWIGLEELGTGGVEVEHTLVVAVVRCGCARVVHVEMSAQSFDTVAGEDAEDISLVGVELFRRLAAEAYEIFT